MKQIKDEKTELTIKLKKDFLTRAESDAIISTAISAFNNKGLIEELPFDYLGMDSTFFYALGLECIENFNQELNQEIFDKGLIEEIIDEIKNARRAYDILYILADKMTSVENILHLNLQQLINKLPEGKDMKSILNKLPKEWNQVITQYNEITGKKAEDDK